MLDTGATHNFLNHEEAKRLGIKVEKGEGSIKTVNAPARPVVGIARAVNVQTYLILYGSPLLLILYYVERWTSQLSRWMTSEWYWDCHSFGRYVQCS